MKKRRLGCTSVPIRAILYPAGQLHTGETCACIYRDMLAHKYGSGTPTHQTQPADVNNAGCGSLGFGPKEILSRGSEKNGTHGAAGLFSLSLSEQHAQKIAQETSLIRLD